MYTKLKQSVKALIPQSFMYKYEMKLRSIYYFFYRGRNYYCNICNSGLRSFIPIQDGDKLCPRCGSLARNRRLYDVLTSGFLKTGQTILDFSPSRNLYRVLKNSKGITYLSTDFSGDFLADYRYDITNINLPDSCVDLIICYHILEHIDKDAKAMNELYRVLKPGGICLIQTPFKAGDIYENPLIQNPNDRLIHFGQDDHVRIYSADGLKNRLSLAGFEVEVLEFNEPSHNKNGYKEKEYVLKTRKKQ
jgi:SAM-dependent methyltransferase